MNHKGVSEREGDRERERRMTVHHFYCSATISETHIFLACTNYHTKLKPHHKPQKPLPKLMTTGFFPHVVFFNRAVTQMVLSDLKDEKILLF